MLSPADISASDTIMIAFMPEPDTVIRSMLMSLPVSGRCRPVAYSAMVSRNAGTPRFLA